MARTEQDFEEFVRGRSAALLRTAYVLTGDRGHAEDLLQDVLAAVHLKWRSITQSPMAYAQRALVHGATNRWRLRRRRLPERSWSEFRESTGRSDGVDSMVDRDVLIRALGRIPIGQRAVIVLRYLDDLSQAETAAVLGCGEGTVKSQSARGLARLRELLEISDEPSDTAGRTR